MWALRVFLLLMMVPACATKPPLPSPLPLPSLLSPPPDEPSARVVKVLEGSFHEDGAFGTRHWAVVPTSPPLLFSRRTFVDARSGAPLWVWRGQTMRTVPRATGNGREIAFVPEAESSFLPISELIVADVALGREVARHPLGVARELWLGERGVAVRATAEAPLRFTRWDGHTITLPWTGDVHGIEAGPDAVIVRTHARGRIERRSFDALTGASSGDVTVSEAPRGVEIERTAERWRLVRGDTASSYTTRWEAARILRASSEEVLVSALHCLDRGDRQRGRVLAFDRDLKMRRVISVPARDYEVVERTPTTLRLLAGGYARECPDKVAFWDHHHWPVVPPALLEIELPR